jgi:cytosine permease
MASLPSYVAAAKPVPLANRAPWYKNTAQTYAGIMLWFVFWHDVPMLSGLAGKPMGEYAGGSLAQGLGTAFIALILAALICHFLFYIVPGMLGMKTGLPLYIVGTSTYGVQGGFIMPGFLMGLLQFGWLAVNAFAAGALLCAPFNQGPGTIAHAIVATIWAIVAGYLGLKGIQYVAKVATFFPIIPLAVLVILLVSTVGGLSKFDSKQLVDDGAKASVEVKTADGKTEEVKAKDAMPAWGVLAMMCTYVVGFFATAGAAGCDFGMNNRNAKDVQLGGLVGIAGATVVAGGISLLVVAGAHGSGNLTNPAVLETTALLDDILGSKPFAAILMYLLAIAAFPAACFSSFIAANSFKTTLPNVNPFVSCGIGTLLAIVLAVAGWAGNAVGVFTIIGASFGPVCGAMMADYFLAGRKWAGPRAGFNPAGWISWLVGFIVGALNLVAGQLIIPAAPVAAFIVGFVLYVILAKAGLESQKLDMPPAAK